MNLNGPSATMIDTIIAATDGLGVAVPTTVTDAAARYKLTDTALRGIYVGGNALAAATLAALDAGQDPTTDHDVQRIVTSHAIGDDSIGTLVRSLALQDLVAALASSADDLVTAWQTPFNSAAQDIADAAKELGPIDLSDAASILQRGGDVADTWTKANSAVITIGKIVDAWTTLAIQTDVVLLNNRNGMLRFTDPTFEQWNSLELSGQRLDAWAAYSAGLTLSLASPADYMARGAAIDQAYQALSASADVAASGKTDTSFIQAAVQAQKAS